MQGLACTFQHVDLAPATEEILDLHSDLHPDSVFLDECHSWFTSNFHLYILKPVCRGQSAAGMLQKQEEFVNFLSPGLSFLRNWHVPVGHVVIHIAVDM